MRGLLPQTLIPEAPATERSFSVLFLLGPKLLFWVVGKMLPLRLLSEGPWHCRTGLKAVDTLSESLRIQYGSGSLNTFLRK